MMGGLLGFLFIYILGGLTFLPLLAISFFLHAYLTLPTHDRTAYRENEVDSIIRPGDDIDTIKRAQTTLGEKNSHEAEVAAGYFAVCREYVPGGVNGKPPERNTPLGSTVVSAPSQSVYQGIYRSIFDRKTVNSPLDNKGVGKPQRQGGNVFYVVLRHKHLILYDTIDQLEVRLVISLAHHHVSIYSGGDETPEGELFIKRNALCLSRKADVGELTPDGKASKPFFLFSENCSDKEDFYFALLRNQERKADAEDNPPFPLRHSTKDIITLVQRLHSSEEHLQTRWINAVIGRVFLALYKTTEVENFVRAKITKKISRVKTPSFLSKIALKDIDMGEAAPVITNPRLKDLTVDGELVVEADVRYTGNFRIVVAATARIELGTRFKAREVDLLLAVVLKRIEGHAMIRIKPPPSNRIWITFQNMPKIEMNIEPIVSSRQITYTLIIRQIENRIKEVVAESLVYPNWDDSPFYHSESKLWRGGIWADEKATDDPPDAETAAAQSGDVEDVQHLAGEHDEHVIALPLEKSMSSPLFDESPPSTVHARKAAKTTIHLASTAGSSSSIDTRSPEKPRALRSGSLAGTSSPIVSTDVINADAFRGIVSQDHNHAGSAMAAISALSQTASPVGSPSRSSRMEKPGSQSSASSQNSIHSEKDVENEYTLQPQARLDIAEAMAPESSYPSSPTSVSNSSFRSEAPSAKSLGSFGAFAQDLKRENSTSSSTGKTSTAETKRLSLAAVTNAAASAKKWGWNAIQRHGDQRSETSTESVAAPLVMGRGRPLPPPGTPLPPPDRKTKTAPIPVPKRKPIPPPDMPAKHKQTGSSTNVPSFEKDAVSPPPLPKRRSPEPNTSVSDEGLFVVTAPHGDSEPTTPMNENGPANKCVEDMEENQQLKNPDPPRLPNRRPPHRVLSSSPVEDGPQLPSWLAAQEEEARVKSTLVDEDTGV